MPAKERKGKNDVLVVRKINKAIYNKFRERALEEHRNVGDALNQAMVEGFLYKAVPSNVTLSIVPFKRPHCHVL